MNQPRLARSLVAAAAAILLLGACDASISFGDGIKGTGELVSTEFDLDDFDKVEVSDALDAYITVGEDPLVEVLTNTNLVEELDIRVRNGVLKVGLRDNVSIYSGTVEATIQLPELTELDVSGASEVTVIGSSGGAQLFDISGSSDVEVVGASGSFTIDISGSSGLRMDGTGTEVTIDASGASDTTLDLAGIERAFVDLSGASFVELESADRVTGDISGASDLTVPEDARVDVSTSGSSDIQRD